MKRKALALAAIMSATLLCSCAQQGGNASDYAQQNMQAVMGSTMNDYVTSSKVTSADSTAASMKNCLFNFITECDTMACGMKRDGSCTVTISVTNGSWTASISDTSCFNASGDYYWENDGVGSKLGDSEDDNLVNRLELDLADIFPDVQNAYIGAYFEGGRPMFVYYTDNTTGPVPELDAILTSQEARDSFKWASGTHGISQEGFIVGTAPQLP